MSFKKKKKKIQSQFDIYFNPQRNPPSFTLNHSLDHRLGGKKKQVNLNGIFSCSHFSSKASNKIVIE